MDARRDQSTDLTNWAGNHTYVAARLHEPGSIEELQEIVRDSRSVRALGSRHSFNDIADTTGDLVTLRRMPTVFELDARARSVTIDGGMNYGELCPRLATAGFALHNLASLPHISVAGGCATATHGSGNRLGNLATAVTAIELVTADGECKRFARGVDQEFDGVVVSLGALGIVTRLTLAIEPTYDMRQYVFCDLPFSSAIERVDELLAMADSVSLFTEWRAHVIEQVWLKSRDLGGERPTLAGAVAATQRLHPIGRLPAEGCTEQLGIVGRWFERLPHFRIDHTPSSGAELQSEYLIPRELVAEALIALSEIRNVFGSLVLISEVRTVAADALWLSSAYLRDSAALHFTWVPDWEGVRAVLPAIEAALAPFDPRPHWGKVFTVAPAASYARASDFARLAERLDPNRTFSNAFVELNVRGVD